MLRNMVGDCFGMLNSGKPTDQVHHTSTYGRLLLLKIYANLPLAGYGHTVILWVTISVIQSYCLSYGHTVGNTVIRSDSRAPVMVACNYIYYYYYYCYYY